MKKLALIPLLCLFIACSDDLTPVPEGFEEVEDVTENPSLITDLELNGYTFKDFNTNNGRMMDSSFFELKDNRIASATEVEMNIQRFTIHEFTYIGDRLFEIATFINNERRHKRTFTYRGNRMTEMLLEVPFSGNSHFYKYNFTHTADTIFMAHRFSTDGINFEQEVDNAKLVLDENENLVFYENYHHRSKQTTRINIEYNARNNPISEVHSTLTDNVEVPIRTDIISVDKSRNPMYDVMLNTYGKKTLMLLYNLQVNDLSFINARVISPYAISSFETDAAENRFTFEINNEVKEDGFSELSSYKTFTQGDLTRHIEIEFIGR